MLLKNKINKEEKKQVLSTIDRIIGTWKLKEIFYKNQKDNKINYFGPNPKGILMYDSFGYMNAQLGYLGRNHLKNQDPEDDKIKIAAYDSYMSYYGKYYETEPGTIIHKIEGCSNPSWEGTEETRYVIVDEEILYITTPQLKIDETITKLEVYWERVK